MVDKGFSISSIASIFSVSEESKEWEAEGIKKGIEQGSEKKELEMYQTMVDKGFSISSIASIFSVSEESIERLLMKV